MKVQLLLLITLFLLFSSNAQDFQNNYIQYSSTGVNSSSGADILDFDGDGYPDILLGMEQRTDLLYIKNNLFTYTPSLLLDTLQGCTFIKAIDFNEDGYEDFIVGAKYQGDNLIFIYYNDGTFQYNPVLIGNTGTSFIKHMEIGDFDGDSDNDIILTHTGSNNALYLLQNNDGVFNTSTYSVAGPISYFRKKDLNEDNVPDLLIGYRDFSTTGYVQAVLECDNTFNFTNHPIDTTSYIESAIIGNFSNGNGSDIILGAASGTTTSALWKNNGDFQFSNVQQITVPSGAYVSIPVDYDDDGNDDFFATNSASWQLLINNGGNNFSAVSIGDYRLGIPIAFVDMNNDQLKDIVSHTTSKVQILKNSGNNVFERIYTNYDEGNDQLVIADITGEGRKDIVASGYTKLSVFKQSFEELIELPDNMIIGNGTYSSGTKIDRIIEYDKDYDGDIDFLCHISRDLYWLINDNGVFTEEYIGRSNHNYNIAVGDLNNNQMVDILIYSIGGYQRFEWNGSGYTESQITGGGGNHFVLHDYDDDNDLDILYLTSNGSNVELRSLTNEGNTAFADDFILTVADISSTTTNAPNNKSIFKGVDIDGDNDLDLFILSPHENKLVWLECLDEASYSSTLISDQLNNPLSMSFNDINNINGIDIVVANRNDNEILLFENDGNQSFNRTVLSDEIIAPENVIAIDFDNDGDIDIAYSTNIHDRIGWFENLTYNCPRTFSRMTETICPIDSIYFGGNYLSANGFYYDTLQNSNGCDSICGLELFNYSLPSITILASNLTLSVPSGYAYYQWYIDNTIINNETNNTIDATLYGDGIYTVEVTTNDGCNVSSEFTMNYLGIHPASLTSIQIYPNPVAESVTIDCGTIEGKRITLFSYKGECVKTYKMSSKTLKINLDDLSQGVYFIQVETPKEVVTTKIIKE
jgi:hypothetical protein